MGNKICNETRPRKEKASKKIIRSIKLDDQNKQLPNPNPIYTPNKPSKAEDNINRKFTYRANFSFIPQIEIKFNEVKDITKELIDNLLLKLNQLFPGKDVKIIEMKKGSLDIAIALNYLIQEALRNTNIHNISVDKLLETLNDTLNTETGNVKNMLQENLVIGTKDQKFKPDFINQNLLDLTTKESKDKLAQSIKGHFSKNDNQNDIFEISKNITPQDIEKFFDKLIKETKDQQDDLKDIILNNKFQDYLRFFEDEFEKTIKNTIFEYSIKFIAYIYRDDTQYRNGKNYCPNMAKKIVFHGTKSEFISSILGSEFRHAGTHFFGIGTYFTDLLDYAWFYAAETDNDFEKFKNVGRIPQVKESFSFIASEIYYDSSKFEQVYDRSKENDSVPKYGVRHVLVNHGGAPIHQTELPTYKRFIGTEYIITETDQILPLLNVTVERVESLIVWRDNNFDPSNPNGYSNFNEMLDFNLKIKKYAAFNFKTKIYYFYDSNEALNFIKRKKYNKIILITNGANDGIGFINNARKIIGSNTISLFTCYVEEYYMDIVKDNENIFLNSKNIDCIKEFLNFAVNKNIDSLKNLQNLIENKLKEIDNSFYFKPLNDNAFYFPNFKEGGRFSELNFD